jgi:hypothetical protein
MLVVDEGRRCEGMSSTLSVGGSGQPEGKKGSFDVHPDQVKLGTINITAQHSIAD